MIAVIVLVNIKPGSRLWGFMRFVLGRFPLRNVPGLRFSKILGSGQDGGFGLKPSATRQGLFCIFDQRAQAEDFLNHSKIVANYRAHADEFFCAMLSAFSVKGTWSGQSIDVTDSEPADGPIAALTRASIRPSKAAQFWRNSPPAEESLGNAGGCLLAVGLGEAPIFRQATFSIWDSVDHMNRYARTGAHMDAIRASLGGHHFSESMFVRFKPLYTSGQWKGRHFA